MPPSCALLGGFVIGARGCVAMATFWKCVAEPSGNPPDVICNEAVPFRPYCAGVATRTRNVSEYMLVLALCLVFSVIVSFISLCYVYRCAHRGNCLHPQYRYDTIRYLLRTSAFALNNNNKWR